jgi:hypothetical protein
VERPLLLVFCCLVLWGTLYGFLILNAAATEGPNAVPRMVLSGRHDVSGAVNLSLTAVAAVVWLKVGIAMWRNSARVAAQGRARRGE